MQRGCMQRNNRKEGPDVWQFLWSETRLDGKRFYHKKIVDTVEQYPDEDAARRSVVGFVSELNADGRPTNSGVLTVAQLCDHFEQRELSKDNTWRSHATKKIYQAYLRRWIRPHIEIFLFTSGFDWKHALDPQFLCRNGLRCTNRRDQRKIRKTLAAFYERDRQYRTMSPWNRA